MSAKPMESPDVFTQEELDAALASGDVVPVCAGDGEFAVSGSAHVRAADAARVTRARSGDGRGRRRGDRAREWIRHRAGA